jgi:hypothetical protein
MAHCRTQARFDLNFPMRQHGFVRQLNSGEESIVTAIAHSLPTQSWARLEENAKSEPLPNVQTKTHFG